MVLIKQTLQDLGQQIFTLTASDKIVGLPSWRQWQRTHLPRQEIQEMWVQLLGQEDSLEQGMGTLQSILAQKISMDRGVWQATVHGVAKSQILLSNSTQHSGYDAMSVPCLGFKSSFIFLILFVPLCDNHVNKSELKKKKNVQFINIFQYNNYI